METETTRQADRPLRRSASDRVVAGVAGGIARRLDIPAWVVRVAFVVLSFGGGLGIALYLAGWLLITDDNGTDPIARSLIERIQDRSGWFGIALVGIGVLIVASSIDFIRGDLAIAVFIGVIGVMLYRGELGGNNRPSDAEATQTPASHSMTASIATPVGDEGAPPVPPPAPPAPVEPAPPPKEPKPPSILGRLTLAVALISSGVMALFDYALTTFDPAPRHYLGLFLSVVGVGLIVGSVLGRARGLIFVGILVSPLLVLSPLAEFDLDSGVGQRRVTADAVTEIAPSYDLAIGELVIDLRDVDFTQSVVEVDASVGIGSLRVVVPDNVGLELDAEVGLGSVRVYGSERNGFAREITLNRNGAGTLTLNADVMVGEVRIAGSDVPQTFTDGFDERITSPAQLQDNYEHDTGDLRLDLSDLVLSQPRTVWIENGIGTITVIVPDRATTTVYAHTDLGQIVLYGIEQGGFDSTVESQATDRALLTLNINLDAGEIIVEEQS